MALRACQLSPLAAMMHTVPMPPSSPIAALSGVLLAAAILTGLTGCGRPQPPPMGPPEVGVVVVRPQPVTLTAELAGRTTPFAVSEVRPQVSGLIKARLFTEGSNVTQGQPLYQIDPAPYRAAYDNAAAALVAAKVKAGRYAALLKTNAIAPQTYDDAQAAYKQAAANLESARINLGYTKVTAPIAGRIGVSSVTVGALVTASQTNALATIQTLDPIYVDVAQSSSELLALRRAIAKGRVSGAVPNTADVILTLEDGTVYPVKGKLSVTEITVDPSTGAVTLRAIFPNPDGILLPGMYVRATVSEGVDNQAMLVPQQGVSRNEKGEPIAMVVDARNRAQQRLLSVARAVGDQWLVTSGLKSGDRLITEGLQKVHPGTEVKAVAAGSRPRPAANGQKG